jgi:hypothetical protein
LAQTSWLDEPRICPASAGRVSTCQDVVRNVVRNKICETKAKLRFKAIGR